MVRDVKSALPIFYAKVRKFTGSRFPAGIDITDMSAGGTALAPIQEYLELVLGALSDCFHFAIACISDPTGEIESIGCFLCMSAEKYTLNPAGYAHVKPFHEDVS
jgi:hypothetical protein